MAENEGGQKPRLKITSIEQLKPQDINVIIEREDDIIEIPCRMPGHQEYQRLGYEIVDPAPPVRGAGPKGPVYNYSDPAYLQARQEAAQKRIYRRLLAFVQIEVPGATVEEQIANLANTLDVSVVNKLIEVMSGLMNEGSARVEDRAATFHANGH